KRRMLRLNAAALTRNGARFSGTAFVADRRRKLRRRTAPTNYNLAEARHIVLRLSAAAVRFDCGPRHHAELDGFGLEVPEACPVPPRSILQAAAGPRSGAFRHRHLGRHQEFSPALFAPHAYPSSHVTTDGIGHAKAWAHLAIGDQNLSGCTVSTRRRSGQLFIRSRRHNSQAALEATRSSEDA